MATVSAPMPFFAFAPRRLSGLLAGCFIVAGAAAQTPLPKESPFVSTAAPAAAAPAGEVHEFAGVSTLEKKTLVNIYDKQAKKGKWIAVGDTVEGTTVLRYDSAREQVVVRIGGIEKTLTLRKAGARTVAGSGAPAAAVPWAAPAGWNSAPAAHPPVAATVAAPTNAAAAAPTGPAPASTPAIQKPPPPAPGTTAYQEQEARMLVSDLLEIGMAQRKAYEEQQKKAAAGQAATPPAPAPTPSPAPAGEPSTR
jgi:hypothetical protein